MRISLDAIAAGLGGFVIDGEAENDRSGWNVDGGGDVNGDGLTDIIVGTLDRDRSYVVFGKAEGDVVSLAEITAGRGGFALDYEDTFGARPIANAGDVNGDGLDDIVTSSRSFGSEGTQSGRSYVVFGKADGDLVSLAEIAAGRGGFAIDGEAANDLSGESLDGTGDVNGDGLDDLIIGALRQAPAGSFVMRLRGYVVFGKAEGSLVELADISAGIGGFVLDREMFRILGAVRTHGAGDVNGDGFADLCAFPAGLDPRQSRTDLAYVVFGKPDSGMVSLDDVGFGRGGFALEDDVRGSPRGAGDVNGDGLGDLVVSSSRFTGSIVGNVPIREDKINVVFGKADGQIVSLETVATGIGGFAIVNGWSSADGAGDFNADGFDDIVVYGTDDEDRPQAGVVFGKADGDPVSGDDVLQGRGGFAIDGETGDAAGRLSTASGAGDINGDGVNDIVIGAPYAGLNGPRSGRTYVVFGHSDA